MLHPGYCYHHWLEHSNGHVLVAWAVGRYTGNSEDNLHCVGLLAYRGMPGGLRYEFFERTRRDITSLCRSN